MFTYTHTRLLVPNFSDCFKFYKEVMGFEVATGAEQEVYAEFITGATKIALFDRKAMAEAIESKRGEAEVQDRAVLIFAVADVDDSFQILKDRGAEVVAKPKDRKEWMVRTAHFRDPAGNLIEINKLF